MTVKIVAVTVARSDYSIIKPILTEIDANPRTELELVVSGMHLAPEFGHTVDEINLDGWHINARLEHLLSSDSSVGVAKSIGLGVLSFADYFSNCDADFLLLIGDRAEMLAAAIAAQPFELRIAHVHGGETTEGAIDEAFRHSITKMSCLHFATTKKYAERIIQMGEQPKNVFYCGAPALDNLTNLSMMSPDELDKSFNIKVAQNPIIVTYHPETYGVEANEMNILNVLEALSNLSNQIIFTGSNADASGRRINQLIKNKVKENKNWIMVNNLSLRGYYSVLSVAKVMIGNSSSGIIEAGSFGLPVVNIGDRQRGRVSGENVIHVPNSIVEIRNGIAKALSAKFINLAQKIHNPYDNGGASKLIVDSILAAHESKLSAKKAFYDF
ncbi:MAG: UDP-N-acetylglucosamine 2-epimerase (hydrolyzing) [Pelagibacteraceae bacterium TMED65]|nr:MAG: UDP-N-acetylglucosamine 2-epimerase (hydrolyzing) [Pelagibacteraceae bacterium TMED65]